MIGDWQPLYALPALFWTSYLAALAIFALAARSMDARSMDARRHGRIAWDRSHTG